MNAQTPAWHRYLPIVDSLVPGCSESERQTRARIMRIRDHAISLRREPLFWAADQIIATIEQIGVAYATANIHEADLNALRDTMAELFRCASSLEVTGGARGG